MKSERMLCFALEPLSLHVVHVRPPAWNILGPIKAPDSSAGAASLVHKRAVVPLYDHDAVHDITGYDRSVPYHSPVDRSAGPRDADLLPLQVRSVVHDAPPEIEVWTPWKVPGLALAPGRPLLGPGAAMVPRSALADGRLRHFGVAG